MQYAERYGPDDKRLKKSTGGVTTLYLGDDEEHLSSVRLMTDAGSVQCLSHF